MPCNSGVSLVPLVDGKRERFAVRGLYNGLALLADATTNSYWDHITGACVHGPRQGAQLRMTQATGVFVGTDGRRARPSLHELAILGKIRSDCRADACQPAN